jgi:hypothetical protein
LFEFKEFDQRSDEGLWRVTNMFKGGVEDLLAGDAAKHKGRGRVKMTDPRKAESK